MQPDFPKKPNQKYEKKIVFFGKTDMRTEKAYFFFLIRLFAVLGREENRRESANLFEIILVENAGLWYNIRY